MRLVTIEDGGACCPGALTPSGAVIDLRAAAAWAGLPPLQSVTGLLGAGQAALSRMAELVAGLCERPGDAEEHGLLAASDTDRLVPPMGATVFMVATSGNYRSHLAEMSAPPAARTHGFIVSPRSLAGSGSPITLPAAHPEMVDWEGEFCLVLGRACHEASPAEAARCIAGYTIFNDVSARDWAGRARSPDPAEAVRAWRNNILFKQFPTFGPIGPAIVTADEIPDPAGLELTTAVNGRIRQRDLVGNMQFTFGEIVSQLSEVYQFAPGDVVTTGTPAGVGFAQDPPVFLRDGDEVTVSVTGIGCLRNPVIGPVSGIDR
jgi:2-keto-4-pentenoate hydratase/2-oxohepta-3-ene-1,7-dioic acid hydratase in catechol pathway